MRSLVVHYGHHDGTTGSHLAEAAERLAIGTAERAAHGRHVTVTELGTETYLWIESGVHSLPLDTHRTPALTSGYLIDAHLHLEASILQAQLFDVAFVAQRDFIPQIRSVHPQVHWLPLAAPASMLTIPRGEEFEAGFVGNFKPGSPRAQVVEAVARRVRMNDVYRRYSVPEMASLYARSRIVLNPAVGHDLNMRFFEGLACGAAIVTQDVGNGQDDIAVRGRDFFVCDFTDPEGVADEMVRLLAADVSGAEGRRVVAAGHTYDHRIRRVYDILSESDMAAPIRTYSRRQRADLFSGLADHYFDSGLAARAVRQVRGPWDLSRYSSRTFARVGLVKPGKAVIRRRAPRLVELVREWRR